MEGYDRWLYWQYRLWVNFDQVLGGTYTFCDETEMCYPLGEKAGLRFLDYTSDKPTIRRVEFNPAE